MRNFKVACLTLLFAILAATGARAANERFPVKIHLDTGAAAADVAWLQIKFWPVENDRFGMPRISGEAITQTWRTDDKVTPLVVWLEAGKDYELRIDVIDAKTGDPDPKRTYMFSGPKFVDENGEDKKCLSETAESQLNLTIELKPKDDKRANRLFALRDESGLNLIACFGPPAAESTAN